MKIIKSKDNPIYKSALKLLRRKYRDAEGEYLLEGRKPLEDAISLGLDIRCIFMTEEAAEDFEEAAGGPDVFLLDRKLFKNISSTENSQGIIAVVSGKAYEIEEYAETRMKAGSNLVILDGLQDPGNMGTIIRTAEAAGYEAVILMPGCVDVYSPKTVRAAAGSLFRVPVVYGKSCERTVAALKKHNKKIVVTDLEAEIFYDEADLTGDTALVIGNEGRGVSREFAEAADIRIKIPMNGSIESLNAAVAAGILMYQSQKKNDER